MNTSPELISTAIKMIIALVFILGGLVALSFFMKRVSKGGSGSGGEKLIKILANNYIGVKKNISLVEVPGAILVLGITNDSIRLLTKIEDEEILEGLRGNGGTGMPLSFTDHLEKLSSIFKK
jgi:flagellar protein FliO/FliZ